MKRDSEKKFANGYKKYIESVLGITREEARSFFKLWKNPSYWKKYNEQFNPIVAPSPVQRVQTRIKRIESVIDKIHRRPDVFGSQLKNNCFLQMKDTLGVRVVIYFLSHLTIIDKELRKLENEEKIEISKEDPPKAYLSEELVNRLDLKDLKREDKESGYVSIHYVLRLRNSQIPKNRRPWFELQVRTLAEDTWGEIEHLLGYKPNRQTSFAVKKQFQIISRQLAAIDEHFNFIYEELHRFQEEVSLNDTDVLNAENLPQLLNSLKLMGSQKEINGIIKILRSRDIKTVGEFKELATKTYDLIKKVYHEVKGEPPNNHETVATMAYLKGINDESSQIKRIKEWIEISKIWDDLKSEHFTPSKKDSP